jgi:sugar-specific transcriptional regulator TrmB
MLIKENKLRKGFGLLGLTSLEAKVCIKLLQVDKAKVASLAKQTGVTRTQLYPLLEKLVEKGFVRAENGRPATYSVLEPAELVGLLEQWKRKELALLSEVEKLLRKLD